MPLIAPFAVLVVAGALALACVTPASAATGQLRLFSPYGQQEYSDPAPGCYAGPGPDTLVVNNIDSVVLLFPDDNCQARVYWPVGSFEVALGHDAGSVRVLG